jgi:hypothetical protein
MLLILHQQHKVPASNMSEATILLNAVEQTDASIHGRRGGCGKESNSASPTRIRHLWLPLVINGDKGVWQIFSTLSAFLSVNLVI